MCVLGLTGLWIQQPAKAKIILESLLKNGQSNAANILRERILQCESADILATKELGKVADDQLKSMLAVTKSCWKLFALHIKTKLFHRKGTKLLNESNSATVIQEMSRLLQFKVYTFADDAAPFDMEEPTLTVWLQDFIIEAHDSAKAAGLLSDDAECLVGMAAAMKKDNTSEEEKHPKLQSLMSRAEETCMQLNTEFLF